jgi:hypothetical protein
MSDLLPPNKTPFESALSQAVSAGAATDPATIKQLYRPASIPARLLPWLAWGLNVPAWPDDDKVRRGITSASWNLHRRQGTEFCYKAMARWMGAEVVRTITPPAKTFCAPSMTQSERNRFLNRMPQLRLFSYRDQGSRSAGQAMLWEDIPVAAAGRGMFPMQSDAAARFGIRAFRWDRGSETPLKTVERKTSLEEKDAVTISEVREPGNKGHATWCGGIPDFIVTGTAGQRIFTLQLDTPYIDRIETLHKHAVTPGLDPVSIRYDMVAERGSRRSILLDGSYIGEIASRSTAPDRLYKRLYLFDPARTLEPRGMSTHLGGVRLGMPPYHAEVAVRISRRASAALVGRYIRGYLPKADKKHYHAVLDALKFARREADKIMIRTRTKAVAAARRTIKSGQIVSGQWIGVQ